MEMTNMIPLASRTGRQLQRYESGRRQVVGSIPYRYSTKYKIVATATEEIEVLLVSSQKDPTVMLLPKGGWETDETMEQAACRESLEEAGVQGTLQSQLPHKWSFGSKSKIDTMHDGYMFPLLVEKQVAQWPEQSFRHRKWVKIDEAKRLCPHLWMREALELFVQRIRVENNKRRGAQPLQPLHNFFTHPASSIIVVETKMMHCDIGVNKKDMVYGDSQILPSNSRSSPLFHCRVENATSGGVNGNHTRKVHNEVCSI